jgi:hypothetical protein
MMILKTLPVLIALRQVVVHERTHTGDKPFKCRFCDFRSAQGGHVRIHERRHTGEKPYTCPFCPYAAVTSTATTSHVMSMHPGCDPNEVPRMRPRRRGRHGLGGSSC